MSKSLIEAIGLAVELGGRRVIDGVSLRAESGQVVAVVGPNGAGKTTLLRALAGLVTSSGELRIAGEDPRSASAQANARHRAYCAQKPACAWDYRVNDLGEIVGTPDAYAECLARLSLADLSDRRLTQLSGGEQKAALLAMTFASLAEPFGAALLLDEPAASLDIARQALVAAEIRRFAQAGGAAIVATHDLTFARECDAVLVLAEGRAIGLGAPSAALTPAVIAATWGASAQAEA
jgi:iron complex transport system ATP-binding protein